MERDTEIEDLTSEVGRLADEIRVLGEDIAGLVESIDKAVKVAIARG
jgi:hypothetical protein